jgi:hypothetical protein
MDTAKVSKLDAKLREMFEVDKLTEARRIQRKSQSGTGNIIRRRKGKEDKRISL